MTDETDAPRRDEQTRTGQRTRLLAFTADDRSVSEVLGAILIFGLLILLLVLVQVNAVPAANQQVEFEHNQRVQGDMQELQETLLSASAAGREGAVSIEAGVGYPTRLFLLNPPRASGTVETTASGQIELQNVRATSSEIDDYLDGTTTRTFDSGGVAYRVNYNEYRGAPTTIYENGVLYNNFTGNRSVVQERGAIISGREISLVTLRGSLSTSSDRSIPLGITPISAPTRTVSVTNEPGSPMTITVPTRLGPDAWRALLDEELEDNGGHITRIRRGTADRNTVVFTLEEGITYDLRMSAIGVGSGYARSTQPQYITTLSGNGTSVPESGTHQMVAEVRDVYNNPVSNVTVNASVTLGDGSVEVVGTNQTNDEGQVTLEYTAGGINTPTQDVEVSVWIGDSATPPVDAQRVANFSLTVFDVDGSGQTNPNQGGAGNPLNPGTIVVLRGAETRQLSNAQCQLRYPNQPSNGRCLVDMTLENRISSTTYEIEEIRLSAYYANGETPPTQVQIRHTSGTQTPANQTTLTVGADFTTVDLAKFQPSTSGNADQETLELTFDPSGGQPQYNPQPGDFFIFEVVYADENDDESTITYVAVPDPP